MSTPAPACAAPGCTDAPAVQWRRRSAEDPTATLAVHACTPHAIALDLAAHVHAADCTAPDPVMLPGCGCSPEPIPRVLPQQSAAPALPPGWSVAVPRGNA